MTNQEPQKRSFYWAEGVTRQEVEMSLADRRPSPLRRQGPRRLLVSSAALVMVGLALTVFIGDNKNRTYSEVILMVLAGNLPSEPEDESPGDRAGRPSSGPP